MQLRSQATKYILCLIISILCFSTQQGYAKDWHYKSEGDMSHVSRAVENTKGHVKFLLDIDIGKRKRAQLVVDALIKGALWDLPPAILEDIGLIK